MRDPHDHRVDRDRVGEANDLGPTCIPPGIGQCVPSPTFPRVEEIEATEFHTRRGHGPRVAFLIGNTLHITEAKDARNLIARLQRLLAVAGAWAALLLALLAPTVAAAQSDEDRLMRTAWSECGVDCAPHEIAALHEVIAGIAEREDVRWSTAWRLASPRLAAGTISRTWLAGITERCEEPAGWPRVDFVEADGSIRRAPRWSRWRARCLTLAENVRAVMSGEVTSLCAAAPRVWGDVRDRARGEARGRARFVEVDCGETALVFGEWEAL